MCVLWLRPFLLLLCLWFVSFNTNHKHDDKTFAQLSRLAGGATDHFVVRDDIILFPTLCGPKTIRLLIRSWSIVLSWCIMVFLTIILARTLDSLVRVSRRVDKNHFVKHSMCKIQCLFYKDTAWDVMTKKKNRSYHYKLVKSRLVYINNEACTSFFEEFLFMTIPNNNKVFQAEPSPALQNKDGRRPILIPGRVPLPHKNMLTCQKTHTGSLPTLRPARWRVGFRVGWLNPGWARKTGSDRFPLGNFKHF